MAIDQKKVLILIEGLGMGGTSSSLLNLIEVMRPCTEIDITVGLINMEGREQLPKDINVLDCSCFSRRYKGKINTMFHILRTDVITWARNKYLLSCEKKKIGLNTERVSLVQKYELSEARRVRCKIDLSEEYDVVISWCEMYTNYLLAEKIIAKKKVAWIHPHYEQAGFVKEYDKKMVDRVDRVVAVSKAGKDALVRAFPAHANKFCCVYNKLVYGDIIKKSNEEKIEFDQNNINMITVSRIQNHSKAYDRTLRVMKRLKEEGFCFRWYIIGDGENRETVQKLIYEYGLEQEIKMLGEKTNPFPYVAAADVFLLCSYYEGFPMVVDEAKALGVPVLVTNYAAAKEQVENGKGGLIVPNTEEGIYAGLSSLLRDNEQLFNYKKFLKQSDRSVYEVCDDFVSLITELCEKRSYK